MKFITLDHIKAIIEIINGRFKRIENKVDKVEDKIEVNEPFIINCKYQIQNDTEYYTIDKYPSEVKEAIDNGKIAMIFLEGYNENKEVYYNTFDYDFFNSIVAVNPTDPSYYNILIEKMTLDYDGNSKYASYDSFSLLDYHQLDPYMRNLGQCGYFTYNIIGGQYIINKLYLPIFIILNQQTSLNNTITTDYFMVSVPFDLKTWAEGRYIFAESITPYTSTYRTPKITSIYINPSTSNPYPTRATEVKAGLYWCRINMNTLQMYPVLDAPTASSTSPIMDGVAAVGTSTNYARADHVHPSDTSKANTSDVLTKTNAAYYAPTTAYNPATKIYVDSATQHASLSEIEEVCNVLGMNATVITTSDYEEAEEEELQ